MIYLLKRAEDLRSNLAVMDTCSIIRRAESTAMLTGRYVMVYEG